MQMGEDPIQLHLHQSLYLQSSHHLSLPPPTILQRENNPSISRADFKMSLCKQSPTPHAAKSPNYAISIPKLILPEYLVDQHELETSHFRYDYTV